ncbi:MAG: hypothetical protein LC790_14005 [Actinobacteria bacterium]|nr:hypothetical protein [Actinomycetota bacterium]
MNDRPLEPDEVLIAADGPAACRAATDPAAAELSDSLGHSCSQWPPFGAIAASERRRAGGEGKGDSGQPPAAHTGVFSTGLASRHFR